MMVDVFPARTLDDFRAFRDLLDEMANWDAAETLAAGQDPQALLAECYGGSAEDLLALFTTPGSAMFLACRGGRLIGSAGFSTVVKGLAEVEKVYVRPEARGLGVGAALLEAVMTGIAQTGHQRARLETAQFMTAAIALYRRFGFTEIAAFRAPVGDLGAMSLFMDCDVAASRAIPR